MSIDAVPQSFGRTRRQFLWQAGAGFAGVALTALLDRDGFFAKPAVAATLAPPAPAGPALAPLAPKPVHFPAKAKSCIFIFLYGGPSAVDMFDYKPQLQNNDG